MSLWMVIVLLGLAKLPIAALMLWIPFRNDQAMNMAAAVDSDESSASDDDGGSKTLPTSPLDPHPRAPHPHPRRRGPHGSDPLPPSPPRVRTAAAGIAVKAGTAPARARPSRSSAGTFPRTARSLRFGATLAHRRGGIAA